MGGWCYHMRMKILLFPHLHRQNVSDSRENEKVQLFFEVNIKLLCGRHKIFHLALDVTRIVMKCSTSLMCLRYYCMKGIQDIWYPQTVRRHLLTLHGRSVSKVRCQGLKEVCLIKVNISCRAKHSTLGTDSNWQEKQVYKHRCWRRLRKERFAFGTKSYTFE